MIRKILLWSFGLTFAAILFGESMGTPNVDKPYRKVLVEDIKWFDEETKHKDLIVRGINMVMRDTPECRKLLDQPANLMATKSNTRSTKDNPVWFVSCENGNVWFSKSDVETNAKVGAATLVNAASAIETCKFALRKAGAETGIKTENVSSWPDIKRWPSGRTLVTINFDLNNGEGNSLPYAAVCAYEGRQLASVNLCEIEANGQVGGCI